MHHYITALDIFKKIFFFKNLGPDPDSPIRKTDPCRAPQIKTAN
jgi:hypothetical protein